MGKRIANHINQLIQEFSWSPNFKTLWNLYAHFSTLFQQTFLSFSESSSFWWPPAQSWHPSILGWQQGQNFSKSFQTLNHSHSVLKYYTFLKVLLEIRHSLYTRSLQHLTLQSKGCTVTANQEHSSLSTWRWCRARQVWEGSCLTWVWEDTKC